MPTECIVAAHSGWYWAIVADEGEDGQTNKPGTPGAEKIEIKTRMMVSREM